MSSKNERLDITMRLLGARQMETEGKKGEKVIKGVGTATTRTGHATTKTAKATGVLTKSYGQLGKAARYGIGFLGVGGVLALESAVHNTEELSKTTSGLNRNLGLSVETGSEWAAVAQARGIATTALNMSFTKLGKSFVEANRKGGTARTALNQLGITYNQTSRGAHDFNYALDLTGKKLGEAEAGPKRQSAAMALLGKGYSAVLPLFAQGNKGLQEQLHWAKEYGVTLDEHTNDALMEMVNAQRENKVAMLGLQVSMTKALMPAINAGDEQLQKFIKTLNDPDMSGAEKITAIQHQFEGIEDTLIKVISAALPKIAEHAGQLGVKMAEALWEGFRHSNIVGKLVIAGWIFNMLGGEALVMAGAKSVGARIGLGLGLGLGAAVVTGFVAYEIWEHMSRRTQDGIRSWARGAAGDFVNVFIQVINGGIEEVNDAFDAANGLSFLGVDAPHIPEIGEVDLHSDYERSPYGEHVRPEHRPHYGPKTQRDAKTAAERLKEAERQEGQRRSFRRSGPPTWSGPPIVIHHKTVLDGKVVAESTTRHAENAAALL